MKQHNHWPPLGHEPHDHRPIHGGSIGVPRLKIHLQGARRDRGPRKGGGHGSLEIEVSCGCQSTTVYTSNDGLDIVIMHAVHVHNIPSLK